MDKPRKQKKVEESQPLAIVKKELVLEGDPQQQLAFAKKSADALMEWVKQKPKKVMIRGEQFLEFGDWQILGRFYGATVGIEWSRPLMNQKGDAIRGYEARAQVLRNGEVISSAEAMCLRAEKNWASRDEFMLKSMAQTRASAKALRQAFGWVAELAGMRSTPAEEMGEQYDQSPIEDQAVPTVHIDDHEEIPNEHPQNSPPLKPQRVAPKIVVDALKRELFELVNSIVMVELETKEEYQDWVEQNTGLKLEEGNYKDIIERLKTLKK